MYIDISHSPLQSGLFLYTKMKELKKFTIDTSYSRMLADVVTPVSIYLKIRDRFANSILLESSDYHGAEDSFSYICCNPMAGFSLKDDHLIIDYPDGSREKRVISKRGQVVHELSDFISLFEVKEQNFKFIDNGLFGYMSYDAVRYFEDIQLDGNKDDENAIPDILYQAYRNVIVIDHFKNEMYIMDHRLHGEEKNTNLSELTNLVRSRNLPKYDFNTTGEECSSITDNEFLDLVREGKKHCFRGDVFQIVLSRRFSAGFEGDEFNVYRALRSINPSPYLFYFDFGFFKVFGSSPEAQIVIKKGEASIFPIAGTFMRTGDDAADAALAKKLADDTKENSEHVMLVDLARNDLSRNGRDVGVETFKEIQYYSHVIHLVSKVTGKLDKKKPTVQMVADTFPAGTLSGAPKPMAMTLIDRYEKIKRGYYGGAIGFLGFNGDFNHAIMIRTFLSSKNKLIYQAGAGIVAKSVEESELLEVNNKLAALRKAIDMAQSIDNE